MPYSTYLTEHMGSAMLTPSGPFVAGSHGMLHTRSPVVPSVNAQSDPRPGQSASVLQTRLQ